MQPRWCCRLVPSRLLRLCLLAAVWLAGLAGGALVWAMTEPGTFLYNQAEVRYFDPLEGRVHSVRSNVSRVMIAERADFTLFDAKDKVAAPGQTVEIDHRLINTGNAADTYTLTLENQADDSLDLNELGAYHDLNGNGVVDPGEPRLDTLPQVLPGEGLDLVIRGTLPATAVEGQLARLRLVVSSVKNPAARVVIEDSVKARNGAAFTLAKQSSASCQAPQPEGSTLSYQVTATNNGNQAPPARDIRVNGNPARGVLIEDPLAANVRLLADQSPSMAPLQSRLLVQPVGNAPDDYLAFDDWQGEPVEQVALLVPVAQLAPNRSAEFTFKVEIKRGLTHGTQLYNQAQVNLGEGITFKSRAVCNQVETSLAPEIRFQQAGPEVVRQGRAPRLEEEGDFVDASLYRLLPTSAHRVLRDGIFLRIKATQLTQSVASTDYFYTTPAGIRLFTATVSSSGTGDSVDVVVRETAPDSGVFRSVFPLVITPTRAPSAQASATPEPSGPGLEWLGIASAHAQAVQAPSSQVLDICPATTTLENLEQYTDGTLTEDALNLGCSLQSQPGDRLSAAFEVPLFGPDNSVYEVEAVTDLALVDATGTLFDSATGEPVEGATVTLWQSRLPLAEAPVKTCQAMTESDFVPAREALENRPVGPEDTRARAEQAASSQAGAPRFQADNAGGAGAYQFTAMQTGYCYHYAVAPPPGYTFPSVLDPPSARQLYPNIRAASWGRQGLDHPALFSAFGRRAVGDSLGAFLYDRDALIERGGVFVDIPLDPTAEQLAGELLVEKQADLEGAGAGDVVSYQITLTNNHEAALYAARILDLPPIGFRFIPDSHWLEVDDERIALPAPGTATTEPAEAPAEASAGKLAFALRRQVPGGELPIILAAGESVTLHYAMRLSAGVIDSDGINRASATARTSAGFMIGSNQDEAEVRIHHEGVLSERAILFGSLRVPAECQGVEGPGGWPLAGVRLYLNDGSWVVSDAKGQFSLFELRPGLHTLKVDPLTLPAGVRLVEVDNRQAGDPQSRFVELGRGDFHRADFAAACPTEENAEALKARLRQRRDALDDDWVLDRMAASDPLSDGNRGARRSASATDLASGRYDEAASTGALYRETTTQPAPDSTPADGDAAPAKDAGEAQMRATDEVAPTITRAEGEAGTWRWPQGDISRDGRFQAVVMAGITPQLFVNDAKVDESHLGEQILNRREQAQVISWYGVPLEEGVNTVEVRGTDPFGNLRVLASREVSRPATATRMALVPAADTLPADGGRSTLAVEIRLLDANDNPARGAHFVTLDTDRGHWGDADIQPETPGVQVRVDDGVGQALLHSSDTSGPTRLQARSDTLKASAHLDQVAASRPLVATGYLAGRHTLARQAQQERAPSRPAADVPQDGTALDGAFFIKGGVRWGGHLTLAYHSERELDEGEQIRRDLNIDDHYPSAGDASVRGYDARSRSQLYARWELGRSSLMWGDYRTDAATDIPDLGRVQQTLTGVQAVFDNGTSRLEAFAAEPDRDQVSETLRGNGTAMLFRLQQPPARDSERLALITRDRDTPGLVLSRTPLERFADYSLNYFTGDIRFHEPVPSVDEDGNPVFVQASYGLEGSDARGYLIGGVRVRHQLGDLLAVSAGHTRSEHAQDGYRLTSIAISYRLDERNRIEASLAQMTHDDDGREGRAASLTAQREWRQGAHTELRWARAEAGFDNPAADIREGREELRLDHRHPLTERLNAELEVRHSRDLVSEDHETRLGLIGELQLGKTRLRAGGRAMELAKPDSRERLTSLVLGAARSMRLLGRSVSLGAELERATLEPDRRRISADAEISLIADSSLYARYELSNRLGSVSLLNDASRRRELTLGVRSNLSESTEVFTEYRLDGSDRKAGSEAVSGVRSRLEPIEGVSLSPSLEWTETLKGEEDRNALAVSLGVEDRRHQDRRTRLRLETRRSDSRDYYGMSAAHLWRLPGDWSGVVRNDLRLQLGKSAPREGDNVVTLGAAQRPEDNRHHALYLYKWKERWGGSSLSDRTLHLVSTHQNLKATDDLTLSGRLGGKWQDTRLDALRVSTGVYLADARVSLDLNRRWSLEAHAGALFSNGGREQRYSAGLGARLQVRRNFRLGLGYNLSGFRDPDLDAEGYNAEGVYLSLEVKFDEQSLEWLDHKAGGESPRLGVSP